MRERITFVHPPGGGLDPEDLEIQEAGLLGPQIETTRQDRLTIPLDELPPELSNLLRDFEAVHLRWTSPLQYETLDPFTSRISPGLHLSLTPSKEGAEGPYNLCTALQVFGPLECKYTEAFTESKTDGSSASPSYYLHQELESLNSFIKGGIQDYCPELDSICQARMRSLYTASSLDVSFDSNLKAVQLTALWPLRPQSIAVPAAKSRRTEVGILVKDVPPSLESHELGVSGLLSVLGEQSKPSATLFTFPSRHRQSDSSFTSKFLTPTGLHPNLQLSLSSNQPPSEDDNCAPYAYLTLPRTVFADRYQLADELFLASKNLTASRYTSLPVDLEAPAYTTEAWGSNVLLELAPPNPSADQPWTAEVPLHLRYLKPSETGEIKTEIPYPAVFWACSSENEVSTSPFDRANLGFDGLFEPGTIFWHVIPKPEAGNRLMNPVTVPVLKEGGAAWIGLGTTVAVALGFAWVLWKLAAVMMQPANAKAPEPRQEKLESKKAKLELLEQELKTIKEAVKTPRVNAEHPWNPPTPQPNSIFPQQSTPTALPTALPATLTTIPEPTNPSAPPPAFEKAGPTKSRLLGDKLVSGDDIDWYFNKFIQCFHPYVPILRKKDPDECYAANQTLFWVVIYVASRRYVREEHIFATLVEQLSRDIWALLATPNLDMESIHAILFVCAWPFPTIRFVTDPSTTLITVATNACMLMGFHDGKGSHPEFCVGGRQHFHSTDLEASNTWISCCILAQRIATYSGVPSPFLQHNDLQCKKVVEDTMSSELMTLFELQKFTNKMHSAMAGQIATHGGVFESTVRSWEDEFEILRPLVTRVDTDCSQFFLLAAHLEVQQYYFAPPPTSAPPTPLNTLRAYTTAHAILTTALTLETTSKFLNHGPNWTYRTIVDASCILVSTLHSTTTPANVMPEEATAIAQQINTAVQCCSVRDGDLPCRGAIIMDTFWSVRNLLPKFDATRRAWPKRLGAAVTFWCLNKFKDALQEAKKSTQGVNKGLEAFRKSPSFTLYGKMPTGRLEQPTLARANSTNMQDPSMTGVSDIFQDVDWSLLMDDFGWAGDGPVFLGPPQC
ncbi:Fc.00g076760.m01.CDS01 [Cosmosporella sp. VM-42]